MEGDLDADGFRFNSDFTTVTATDRPWIYSCGLTAELTLKFLGIQEKKYRAVSYRNRSFSCGVRTISESHDPL